MSQSPIEPAATETWTKPKPRRRWRRRLLWAGGGLLLVIVLLVALAPTIAGYMAPGIAEKQINALISGSAKVQGASFSWFGSQEIGPVAITTPDGKAAGTVRIVLNHGLTSLAKAGLGWGSLDLGTVTINGETTIVRHADGQLNLMQAVAPRSPGAPAPAGTPGEIKLPPTLAATIVIERLDVKYTDESAPAGSPAAYVELPGVSGKIDIAPQGSSGLAANIGLMAAVRYGPTAGAATEKGGAINIGIAATSLTDPSGRLTPDTVTVNATIDGTELDMRAADALAGMKGQLAAALGDHLKFTAMAKGSLKDAHATVVATSPSLRADLAFKAWDGVITSEKPGVIDFDTTGGAKFSSAVVEAARNGTLALETFPHVTLTVDQVNVPRAAIDAGDFRGVATRVVVETTAIAGKVKVPAAGAAGAPSAPNAPAPTTIQAFRVEPLKAEFATADLGKGATLKASTFATLGKETAGKLMVDLTLGGVLDASGHTRPGLPSLQGKADLTEVSTAIAQPLASAFGVDLAKGVGPKLDATLVAATTGAPDASGLPPTNLDIHVKSDEVRSDLALVIDAAGIRSRNEGLLALKKPVALAGANLRGKGVDIAGDGFAKVTIRDLVVPWDAQRRIDGSKLAVAAETEFGSVDVGVTPAPGAAPADAVKLQRFFANLTLKPGAQPRLDFKGSGSHQNNAFFVQAGLDFPGAGDVIAAAMSGGDAAAKAALVRPVGPIELRNLPTTIATMTLPPPAPDKPDLKRLVQDAVGPTVSVKVDFTARPNATPEARDIAVAVNAAHLKGTIAAGIDSKNLAVGESQFTAPATPELVASLVDALGPALKSKPTLAGPAVVKFTLAPVTIPMSGFAPQLAASGDVSAKIELAEAMVRGLTFPASEGKPARDLGALGFRGLTITATVPLASIPAGSSPRPARADVAATLIGDNAQPVATLKSSALVTLASGAPSGPIKADFSLEVVNTPKLDAILDQPGLVSGAVGDRLTLAANAELDLAPATGTEPGGLRSLDARATVTSPRVKTVQPFQITTKGLVTSSEKPAVLAMNVDQAWANRFLPKPTEPNQPPMLAVSEPVEVTLSLYKISLSLDPGSGPLKAGVFAVDTEVAAPSASLAISGVPAKVKNLRFRTASGKEPNVLGFSLVADDMGGGPAPGGKPALNIAGGFYGIADAKGNPTFGDAKLTATGMAHNVPTAIIDAVTQQQGLLVDALGPNVTVNLDSKGFSTAGGQVKTDATSERATSAVTAVIQKGGVANVNLTATLTQVTPQLGARLLKGMPLIGEFEKRKTDAPATVKATGLMVPLDGNLAKLNGKIELDPGEARFATSGTFGKLLKLVKQRDAGVIGRKLEPLTLTLTNGVATYERYRIPLGEFTVETRGTVDLAQRKLDVITYVPFGALTDEAAGIFNSGAGRILNGVVPTIEKATMVPIRTKGSFDNPSTSPDLELFFQEAGKTLLRPDKIIGGGLDDILKKVTPEKPKPPKK